MKDTLLFGEIVAAETGIYLDFVQPNSFHDFSGMVGDEMRR